MTTTLDIFVSSKMLELREEREALYELIPALSQGLITLRAWVFEKNAPASDKTIRENYLKILQGSALYIGLFWHDYGEWTIDEFDRATEWGIPRHIYVKNVPVDGKERDPKLTDFLNRNQQVISGGTHKWFTTMEELKESVKQSIEQWLQDRLTYRAGGLSAIFAKTPDDITEKPGKLIGRDESQQNIRAALEAGDRVLLQGFGGMGKTALAGTLAAEWIKDGKGSVIWLKAGSAEVEALFEALARPFGAAQQITSADNKPQIVRSLLTQTGATLLVLDDAWNGEALLQFMRAVPSSMAVIVTSRQQYPLNPPKKNFKVYELSLPDALAMLSYYADKDFRADADAVKLCELLGFHAFALEIAGKNLETVPPAQLYHQIKDAPHSELKIPLDFDETGRENIAALLKVSLDALEERERNVFLALGAFFVPRVTPEMLSIYLTYNVKEAETALTELTRRGLAERVEATSESIAYYHIHDLAYSYAKAQANDEQRHRALDACLAYTNRYNEPSLANFAALRPELENFMGAASFAMAMGRYAEVEDFATLLYDSSNGNGGVLYLGGFYMQAINLLLKAVQVAEKQGNQRNKSRYLNNLGLAHSNVGNNKLAIEIYEQALDITRQINDKHIEGEVLGNTGLAYKSLGEIDRAFKFFMQALTITREIGDERGEGAVLDDIGNVYRNLGQVEHAIEFHEQALALARKTGDKRGEGNRLGNLGNDYADLGHIEQAIKYYTQALPFVREVGNKRSEGFQLNKLGNAYLNLGHIERAIEFYEQALVILREIGNKMGEANALNNLGMVYKDKQDYPTALNYYQQARVIYAQIGAAHRVADVDHNIASVQAKMARGK